MRKGLVAAALLAVWIVLGCFEKEQAVPIIDEAMDVISQHGVNVKIGGNWMPLSISRRERSELYIIRLRAILYFMN